MVPVQHIPANGTNFAQINLEVTPSVLQNSAHKVDVQSKNIFYFFPQKVKKLTREVQEFIASFVIHAQSFKKGACISWRETILKQCREKHLPATITNLEIDSSTSLNGVSIQTDHNQPFENQRWIVYFLPNGAPWEVFFDTLVEKHQDTTANVLCYNYRNVGFSTGQAFTEKDLITDGVRIIQSLLDKGVKKEHILLHGFSLGGGVATAVTRTFLDQGIPLPLCNERSFTSLYAVIVHLISRIVPVIGTIIAWIVSKFGWTLNSSGHLQALKGKVKMLVMFHPEDSIVVKNVQFEHAPNYQYIPPCPFPKGYNLDVELPQENIGPFRTDIGTIRTIEMSLESEAGDGHCRSWIPEERNHYTSFVKEVLSL